MYISWVGWWSVREGEKERGDCREGIVEREREGG